MNIQEKRKKLFFIAMLAITFFVVFSFIVLPVQTDIKVFFGNAKLASLDMQHNWLLRPLKTWELKGVGNRTIFLWIGSLSGLFFKYSQIAFVVMSKFIYIVVAAVLVLISTIWQNNDNRIRHFCIIMTILFMCGIECHMQAEMSTVILMIFAAGLFCLKDKIYFSLIAGIVFGLVFFIKSATIIMIISLMALAVYFFKDKVNNKRLITHLVCMSVGALLVVALGLVLIKAVYPTEIKDMLDASKFQSSILSGGFSIKNIVVQFAQTFAKTSIRTIPMLIAVVISIIYIIVKWIKTKKHRNLFLLMAFMVPALYVVALNSFFSYHYYLFMFPLAILWSNKEKCLHITRKNMAISCAAFALIFVLYLALGSVISPSSIRFLKAERTAQAKNAAAVEKVNSGDNILYLDSGVGSYILGQKSYSKYYYPLPIQRKKIAEEKQTAYKKMVNDINSYNGKYITYEKTYMEKDGNLVKDEESIKSVLDKYCHKVATIYYAPNIDLSPDSKQDLIYSIDVLEREK